MKKFGMGKIHTSYPEPPLIAFIKDTVSWALSRMGSTRNAIIGLAVGVSVALLVILVMDFYRVREIANFQPKIATKIYDKNGLLVSELFRQKREVVPYKKIPAHLVSAFIAIEDNEFYSHFGINPKGIVRAFFINIFSGRIRQGGSTITQQLSKILLTSGKRSIFRKAKEAFIALMMEMFYTKDEIMGLYLNQIFLGHGAYGVESASQFYFNKHVWDLNLAESALLATLPSSPNNLSPLRHPKRSMERHKIVLAKMVEMGNIRISEAEKAYLEFWPNYLYYINELPPTMNTWSSRTDKAPWFTEYLRRILIKKYGEEKVFEDGLLVYTTLDVKKQIAAQNIMSAALERQTEISGNLSFKRDDYIIDHYNDMVGMISMLFNIKPFSRTGSYEKEKINSYLRENIVDDLDILNCFTGFESVGNVISVYRKDYLDDKDYQKVEGCLISIDHRNGYIEAMVGGSEFTSINQLNRVMQSQRQPGSAIKPLLYSAAMESRKFTPATAVLDSPLVYLDTEGGDWIPENYEGEYYGLLRLRKALALSINVISIRIADAIGIETVMKYYTKLLKLSPNDASTRLRRNFSIALGTMEVSPLELARAYAIIANGGKDVFPFSIRYIKDRSGKILENNEEDNAKKIEKARKNGSIQVLHPETAQIMISMLQTVISRGTGMGAALGRQAGGKTGTTNNWKDAWFVGFVPQLTTCIWMGYDKLGLSLGMGQAGGAVVAPVWREYMKAAMKDEAVLNFPIYAYLSEKEVCANSGLLPSSRCNKRIKEVFIPGTEPTDECNLCSGREMDIDPIQKGPKENITERHKKSILKNIKRKKQKGSVLENIGNDLL